MPPSSPGRSCRLQIILKIAAPAGRSQPVSCKMAAPMGRTRSMTSKMAADVVVQHGGPLGSHAAEVTDDVEEGVPRESHTALLGFDGGLDWQTLA